MKFCKIKWKTKTETWVHRPMQLVAASSGHSPSVRGSRRPSFSYEKIKSSVNRGRVNRPLELWMDVNGRGTFPSDSTPFIRSLRFPLVGGPFNSILSVRRVTVWPCLWVADSSPPRQIATVSVHVAIHSIYANFREINSIFFNGRNPTISFRARSPHFRPSVNWTTASVRVAIDGGGGALTTKTDEIGRIITKWSNKDNWFPPLLSKLKQLTWRFPLKFGAKSTKTKWKLLVHFKINSIKHYNVR